MTTDQLLYGLSALCLLLAVLVALRPMTPVDPPAARAELERVDLDGDRTVSPDELRKAGHPLRSFGAADLDHDGALDAVELELITLAQG